VLIYALKLFLNSMIEESFGSRELFQVIKARYKTIFGQDDIEEMKCTSNLRFGDQEKVEKSSLDFANVYATIEDIAVREILAAQFLEEIVFSAFRQSEKVYPFFKSCF